MGVLNRLRHAWNAFTNWDQKYQTEQSYAAGSSFGIRPDRTRLVYGSERTMLSSVLTRMSLDVASIQVCHVRNDSDGRYIEDIKSGMNECLTVRANIDQFAQQFRQDIVRIMFDKGVVAIVPVDTTLNPIDSNSYDILSMRAAEIVAWYPEHVRVSLYNQAKGFREQITLPKSLVAIVENPLYDIMNEPNSTMQRLVAKLNLLDAVDKASSSGKLDMIIQLPYVIKSEARRQQAEQRRKDIEFQLKEGQYGIAYTDGTEKITQLNRAVDNKLMDQIKFLTDMLYSQLGITDTIMNGTADEKTMINYNSRTVEPILRAIVEAMRATFLTKTARTQGQSITYFKDPFALVPLSEVAKIADMMARNEILTSNELRQAIGFKPSKDPKADLLQNSNMPTPTPLQPPPRAPFPPSIRQLATRPVPQLTAGGGSSQNEA
jgi:hypothetical protein